jgi:hypothetical protein
VAVLIGWPEVTLTLGNGLLNMLNLTITTAIALRLDRVQQDLEETRVAAIRTEKGVNGQDHRY